MPYLLDIISTGFSNSLTVYWTQRKTRTDNGGNVTEGTVTTLAGGTVTESVLGWETKNASMQNILSFIKVSNNSIDDIEWLLSEIQTELLTLMALELDSQIFNGTVAVDGFDGIYTLASAFAAGGKTLKAGITANNYDVLKFAIKQIRKAHFNPTHVVLNPDDALDMELQRDDNGQYIWPPHLNVTPAIGRVQIIENTGVPTGYYLAGDFKKAKFWMRKGMDLKVWDQNEDDVKKMLKTITLYMRGTLVVKDADVNAFVKDSFADSITEITLV
jgi:HK97 family phage major capsid protein